MNRHFSCEIVKKMLIFGGFLEMLFVWITLMKLSFRSPAVGLAKWDYPIFFFFFLLYVNCRFSASLTALLLSSASRSPFDSSFFYVPSPLIANKTRLVVFVIAFSVFFLVFFFFFKFPPTTTTLSGLSTPHRIWEWEWANEPREAAGRALAHYSPREARQILPPLTSLRLCLSVANSRFQTFFVSLLSSRSHLSPHLH